MIPFVGETVCRAFNFVFIPVVLLLLYPYIYGAAGIEGQILGIRKTLTEQNNIIVFRLQMKDIEVN